VCQQRRVETLPTVRWQCGTIPDVGFSSFESNTETQLANVFFVKRDPAIGNKRAFDPTGITMPPVVKALQYLRWIVEIHGLRQFLSYLRPGTHEDYRDLRYWARRQWLVEIQRPERALGQHVGPGGLRHVKTTSVIGTDLRSVSSAMASTSTTLQPSGGTNL